MQEEQREIERERKRMCKKRDREKERMCKKRERMKECVRVW